MADPDKSLVMLMAGRRIGVIAEGEGGRLTLAYDDMYAPKLKLAMRIGGEYRVERISGRHWRRFAAGNQLDPDATVARIDDLAERTPLQFRRGAQALQASGLPSELPDLLADRVTARVTICRELLTES